MSRSHTAEPLLRLESVSFSWGARSGLVVDDVSATLEQGEMLGLIGPNGAGKSTLLRLCAGLLSPSSGAIRLGGRCVGSWPRKELARTMALVPQETTVPFSFTIEELVLMGRAPHMGALGLEGREDLEVARKALDDLGLGDLAERPLDRVSGGERQRAVIARALAQEPRLLLCDEPLAHLDLHHQARLFRLLRERVESRGVSVVVVLHDLNVAATLCDRLLLLDRGRLAAAGEPGEVIRREILESVYRTELVVGARAQGKPYVLPA